MPDIDRTHSALIFPFYFRIIAFIISKHNFHMVSIFAPTGTCNYRDAENKTHGTGQSESVSDTKKSALTRCTTSE